MAKVLDTKRANNILRWLIIILTVFFAFNAISAYTRLTRIANDKSMCASTLDYYECVRLNDIIIGNIEEEIKVNIYLAIIPALAFFGGTILYKHLFRDKDVLNI